MSSKVHPCCSILQDSPVFFFLLVNDTPLYVYNVFYPFLCGHVKYFKFFAIRSKASMNMRMQISLQYIVFKFWGYLTRDRIAGSYGLLFSIIVAFYILSNKGSNFLRYDLKYFLLFCRLPFHSNSFFCCAYF